MDLGRPRFPRHFTWIAVLRYPISFYSNFKYGAFTLFGCSFLNLLLFFQNFILDPATPLARFRLFRFRSPLLTESLSISFPPGTEMFHFPGSPGRISCEILPPTTFIVRDFSIRNSSDHHLLTTPRRISLSSTSFIGFNHLGIHHLLY